jgi:lipid-A-disaccharide synthase
MPLFYLIAGEPSGDVLGARLMAALRRAAPGAEFAGIGGPRMSEAGLESLFPIEELAVMGLVEVLPRLARLRRRLAETRQDILARRPAALITIDTPGFALRLLKSLAGSGIKRIHYVAPQVWAWREGRVKHFAGLWDRLLCLLPFEPAYFARFGLEGVFVGHPVLESGADRGDGAAFRARAGLAPDLPLIVLMPGSRPSEAFRLLPVYRDALARLAARGARLGAVLPAPAGLAARLAPELAAWPAAPLLVTEAADKYGAFAAAAAALTKSGTSTLELALAGVPMAVTYRVNRLTAAIARRLIRLPHVAMVNVLAGRTVVPELLQENCTGEKLAAALTDLLTNAAAREAQRALFREILPTLRPPAGLPSEAAAQAILEVL